MCPVLTTRPKKSPTGDTWVKRWAWIHTQSRVSYHAAIRILSSRLYRAGVPLGGHYPRGSYRRALHQTARLSGHWRRGHDPNLPGSAGLASHYTCFSLSCSWQPASLPRLCSRPPVPLLLPGRAPCSHTLLLGTRCHSTSTLCRPAWYICVCIASPGWPPLSVVRMHPGSNPA